MLHSKLDLTMTVLNGSNQGFESFTLVVINPPVWLIGFLHSLSKSVENYTSRKTSEVAVEWVRYTLVVHHAYD